MLGKEAELPGLGGTQLQRQPVELDRPGPGLRRRPSPATLAIETEIRARPGVGFAPGPERGRMWPVDDHLAEPFEPGGVTEIDEPERGSHVHAAIMTARRPAVPDVWPRARARHVR